MARLEKSISQAALNGSLERERIAPLILIHNISARRAIHVRHRPAHGTVARRGCGAYQEKSGAARARSLSLPNCAASLRIRAASPISTMSTSALSGKASVDHPPALRRIHRLERSLEVVDVAVGQPVQIQLRQRRAPVGRGLEAQRILAQDVVARGVDGAACRRPGCLSWSSVSERSSTARAGALGLGE